MSNTVNYAKIFMLPLQKVQVPNSSITSALFPFTKTETLDSVTETDACFYCSIIPFWLPPTVIPSVFETFSLIVGF